MPSRRSAIVRNGALGLLPLLALAACSSGGASDPSALASPSSTTVATTPAADPNAGLLSGTRLKTTKVPGVGDETLKAVMSAPQWNGGTTLVATRVGNVVITTFYNVQSSDMGSAALNLTEKIATRVKAAR